MGCSCIVVDLPPDGKYPINRQTEEIEAPCCLTCVECKKTIRKWEKFRKERMLWESGRTNKFFTCTTCCSIRDAFFCEGWVFGQMFYYLAEHIIDMDGEINEDCIVELKPEARDIVCEMLEKYWKSKY